MKISFLGTGAGIPSKERNVSAIIFNLLQEQNELWLFDCGEATQHQILHTTFKPRKINKIFITHLHGDHIFGLPGLLSSRSFLGGDDLVTIYGPIGVKNYVEQSLSISKSRLGYPIDYVEFTEDGIIYENEMFQVTTMLLDHNIDSYGFRIVEKDRIGELNVGKLRDLGIQPGPIFSEIKENEVTVTADGQKLYRKDFVGASKKGRIITIFGDTRYQEAHIKLAENADVIIHEATFDQTKLDLANEYFHSTTVQAATLAKAAGAKMLLLTHISSRYQQHDVKSLLKEAQSVFPNSIIVSDHYTYAIKNN